MPSPTSRGLFVTGTGTEVGKTYVASLIVKLLRATGRQVGVYKPAASGCRPGPDGLVSDDAVRLWEAAGRPGRLDQVCPQRFTAPIAPHLAARQDGSQICARQLREGVLFWQNRSEIVVVEGAGGLMSPLGQDDYNATLAEEFGFPLVIVAANRLGVINDTLQTLMAAEAFGTGLQTAAVVLNQAEAAEDLSASSNYRELHLRCQVPVLARLAWSAECFDQTIDWYALADSSGIA